MKLFLSAFVAFSLSACGILGSSSTSRTDTPEWVYNPRVAGNIVGIGSAKTHIKGPAAQRSLAISRALDEIARPKGVSVSNVTATQASMSATRASSSMKTASQQVVNNNTVNAVIKDEWNNGDELFILMVAE